MKKKYKHFKYIILPNFIWYYLGGKLIYEVKSYWHLNIKNNSPLWKDASDEGCEVRYCMHCGKGKIK